MNLAPHHISTLQSLFAKHPSIKEALLFGSRALGTHRESSDIDIALKGDISPTLIAHLKEELEDSTLPYFCDIISYEKAPKKLKESIDSHALPLYTKEEQWQEVRLGEVVEIKYGKDHKHLKCGTFPTYGSGGIMRYVNSAIYEKESVLIPRKGTLNNIFYTKTPFWVVDTMFYTIIDTQKIYPQFLYYALKTFDFNLYNVGSAVPSLTTKILNDLTIPLPPLERQKEIAEILSSFDDKIDFLHRQNKTLESLAQTLFHHYFIEETQDEKMGVFADEFLITMGSSPIGTSYNTHLGTPLFQGSADFNFRYPNNRIYTTKPTKIANPKDTLLSVRAPVGVINMAKEKCCIGRGLASIRHLGKNNLSSYTYYKTMFSLSKIQTYDDSGTVFGSIKHKELNNIETKILSERQAQKLEKILNIYDDKIEYNTNMITLYEKIKMKYLKAVYETY